MISTKIIYCQSSNKINKIDRKKSKQMTKPKSRTNRNKRKIVRAQITPDQYNKLLALVASHPDAITYGVLASQIIIKQLNEVTK